MTLSSFCFLKGSGSNRLLGSCSRRRVDGVQEIVTSLPEGLGEEYRIISVHQYPAIQEVGSYIYISMVLSPGCKNIGVFLTK